MIKKIFKKSIFLTVFLLSSCGMSNNPICFSNNVKAQINDKVVNLETACTIDQIETGLMNRKFLGENSGMIFVFPKSIELSFWMKNTIIPLDIAYLSEDLVITQIEQMYPNNLEPVNSKQKSMYAIEVNQNWFNSNNIKVGDRVKFLD